MSEETDPQLTLRPLQPARDRGQVTAWLAKPAVQAWWGSPGAAAAEIAIAIDSEAALCRIIEIDGVGVGYAHALEAALLDPAEAPQVASGDWLISAFIASDAYRGRGLGAKALDLLAEEALATTLALGCVVRLPVRNEAAVRAVEAQGFRWSGVMVDAVLGPIWLMRKERRRLL